MLTPLIVRNTILHSRKLHLLSEYPDWMAAGSFISGYAETPEEVKQKLKQFFVREIKAAIKAGGETEEGQWVEVEKVLMTKINIFRTDQGNPVFAVNRAYVNELGLTPSVANNELKMGRKDPGDVLFKDALAQLGVSSNSTEANKLRDFLDLAESRERGYAYKANNNPASYMWVTQAGLKAAKANLSLFSPANGRRGAEDISLSQAIIQLAPRQGTAPRVRNFLTSRAGVDKGYSYNPHQQVIWVTPEGMQAARKFIEKGCPAMISDSFKRKPMPLSLQLIKDHMLKRAKRLLLDDYNLPGAVPEWVTGWLGLFEFAETSTEINSRIEAFFDREVAAALKAAGNNTELAKANVTEVLAAKVNIFSYNNGKPVFAINRAYINELGLTPRTAAGRHVAGENDPLPITPPQSPSR